MEKFEFYFDRDPFMLNSILNYYSNGVFHLNDNVCVDFFYRELEYWGIDIYQLDECCILKYWMKKNAIDDEIKREKLIIKKHLKKDNFGKCLPKFRERIWKILTYEEKSIVSKVYLGVTILVSLISIIELILRSFSDLRASINQSSFDSIELATIIYYTIEFILRFFFCPSKFAFIKSPLNIIDITSIISFYIYLPLSHIDELSKIKNIGRILRAMIVFKCLRFIPSLKIMGRVLVKGFKEISIFLAYVLISVLIISSIMYEIESDYNDKFDSIPATFWWTVRNF